MGNTDDGPRTWDGNSLSVKILYSHAGLAQQITVGNSDSFVLIDTGDGTLRDLRENNIDLHKLAGILFGTPVVPPLSFTTRSCFDISHHEPSSRRIRLGKNISTGFSLKTDVSKGSEKTENRSSSFSPTGVSWNGTTYTY